MQLRSSILAMTAGSAIAFGAVMTSAETAGPTVLAQANTSPVQVQRPTLKRGVSKLSSSDCSKTRGTVVETDGRCGASHQYCKYPDGYVVCVDKRD